MEEDLDHAFLMCDFNHGAGEQLTQDLSQHLPQMSMEKILRLEFGELSEEMELPFVWFTAAFLLAIWERRFGQRRICCYETRAEIEGKIVLLRETASIKMFQS